ncbi:MAG: hypothetical protein HFE39_09090 [Clostridiales bacterium]|jgi:hypothetical protein|nr:hypothetical protein [Clostridiales bacterium]
MNYEKFVEDNSLNYQILEMKFKQGKSYKEIAGELNKSIITIGQRYRMFRWSLYTCYYRYLKSIGLEVDAKDIRNFYQSSSHAVAYLEKTYSEALTLFRGDETPVFLENVKNLPPYRKLTDRQVLNLEKKIVKAREGQGRTFADIGKELKITKEKTRRIYGHYYHKKVMKALDRIEAHTGNEGSYFIFDYSDSSRKRWELIVKDYPDLVQDLIDN